MIKAYTKSKIKSTREKEKSEKFPIPIESDIQRFEHDGENPFVREEIEEVDRLNIRKHRERHSAKICAPYQHKG